MFKRRSSYPTKCLSWHDEENGLIEEANCTKTEVAFDKRIKIKKKKQKKYRKKKERKRRRKKQRNYMKNEMKVEKMRKVQIVIFLYQSFFFNHHLPPHRSVMALIKDV